MNFQGWMGLIVGPIAGGLAYAKFARRNDEPIDVTMLVLFVVVGLVAGAIVWGVDAMRSKKQ